MQFRSLRTKLVVIFGSCFLVLAIALVIYNLFAAQRTERMVTESSSALLRTVTEDLLRKEAESLAMNIDAELEVAMDAGRTFADILAGIKTPQIQLTIEREQINQMLHSALQRNPSFLGTYTLWEPNVDGQDARYANTPGYDATGRLLTYWSRNAAGEIRQDVVQGYEDATLDANGLRTGEFYLRPRETKQESIIDPYAYSVQDSTTWMVSTITPIVVEQTFYGIAGVDLSIEFIQTLVEQASAAFYQGAGTIAVISHRGVIAGLSGRPEMVGKPIQTWQPEQWQQILANVQSGKVASDFNADLITVSVPLYIGKAQTPWSVMMSLPQQVAMAAVDELIQGMHARARQDLIRQAWIAGGIIIVTFAFISIIAKQIVAPIIQSVDFAKIIAGGDLTAQLLVNQRDEIGTLAKALQEMLSKFRQVVSDVKYAAENVATGSESLSSGATEMSQGATEQAAASEEASSSMEEMAANIHQNADNAIQTEKIATKAAADASKSGEAVAQTVTAMREIVRKVTIIEEIARQTHTLSLNATIEAAKAQEYGKGFAVVAAEVRALASRSQDASSEINQMASQSIDTAERAGDMLSTLVPDIQKTADLVQEIGAASREQSSGVEQISRAIQQLDTVIQQNSSISEEMAATSEELAGQAEQLQEMIAFFHTGEAEQQQTKQRQAHRKKPRGSVHVKEPIAKGIEHSENLPTGDRLDEEFERY